MSEGVRVLTNLIRSLVLGIVSLSFFQKMTGGGIPTTRHSSLTGAPSGIPMFCSFSTNWGGCFLSFSKTNMYNWNVHIGIVNKQKSQSYLVLTYNLQLQTEGALPCFIACDAGVCAGVFLSERVNDQGMDAVLSHQHLVVKVWINGPPVDQPHELRVG